MTWNSAQRIAYLVLTLVFLLIASGIKAQKRQEISILMDSLHLLSQQYPDSSLEVTKPLLKSAQIHKWKKEEADLLARRAIAFDLLGKYDSAYITNVKARELFESLNYQKGLSLVHNNLGILAFGRYEYEEALAYFNASLKADQKLGDTSGVAGTLVNIGIITSYLDLPDSSLACYHRASELYRQLGDRIGEAMANSNRAKILVSKGQLEEAKEIYQSVIRNLEAHGGNYEPIVTAYNSLAVVYKELGQLSLAEEYSRKSVDIARNRKLPERLMYCYETLSQILELRGRATEALDYYKRYANTRDSLYSKEKDAAIADIESQYELEKKEKELAISKLAVEKAELEKEKQISQRNMWIGISAFFVLLSFFILQRYRNRTTQSKLLEEKNRLNASLLDQKNALLSEMHHRIKNNLQVISSMLSMQANHVQDINARLALEACVDRVSNIALLHEKLQVGDEQEGIKLKDYLDDLVATISSASGRENCRIQLDLEDLQFPIEVALPIGLIVNELVTNSLKHADPGEAQLRIDISLRSAGDHYSLSIKDNGTIAYEALTEKIDRSFGWQIVKSFSRQIKASYQIKEAPGMEIAIFFSLKKPEL